LCACRLFDSLSLFPRRQFPEFPDCIVVPIYLRDFLSCPLHNDLNDTQERSTSRIASLF
jgi:hypothetical protein